MPMKFLKVFIILPCDNFVRKILHVGLAGWAVWDGGSMRWWDYDDEMSGPEPHCVPTQHYTKHQFLVLLLLSSVGCEWGNELSEFNCILTSKSKNCVYVMKMSWNYMYQKFAKITNLSQHFWNKESQFLWTVNMGTFLAIFYKENLCFRDFCSPC